MEITVSEDTLTTTSNAQKPPLPHSRPNEGNLPTSSVDELKRLLTTPLSKAMNNASYSSTLRTSLLQCDKDSFELSMTSSCEKFDLSNNGKRALSAIPESEDYELDLTSSGAPSLQWCAACRREVTCQITFANTSQTLWYSTVLFFTSGFLGCFMLPYMLTSCKRVKQECSWCSREIRL